MNLHAWYQGTLLLVAAVAAFPALAWAQDATPEVTPAFPPCESKPTDTDVAAAKGAFQAGKVSFDEADYARAITYWEDAFRRDCTATALLLNLARAYELNEEPHKAVTALKTYLEREPNTPDAAPVNRRIEVLEQKMAGASAPAPPRPQTQPAAQPATTEQSVAPQRTSGAEPRPAADEPAARSLTPLIVGGAGLAVFIGAGALYLDAMADVNHYGDVCNVGGTRRCPDEEMTNSANEARTRANVTGVISLLGAATAVGGGLWYLLIKPEAQQAGWRSRSPPALGPQDLLVT